MGWRTGINSMVAASLLLLTACASAPARAPARLYDELGGKQGIAALTDAALDQYADDPRVAPTFEHVDIGRFRRMFSEYICVVADGPCTYTGASMAEAHRGLNLHEAQFTAIVEDMTAAMTSLHIPVPTQNRLIKRLAPVRKDVLYK
jgi:hemoglobin